MRALDSDENEWSAVLLAITDRLEGVTLMPSVQLTVVSLRTVGRPCSVSSETIRQANRPPSHACRCRLHFTHSLPHNRDRLRRRKATSVSFSVGVEGVFSIQALKMRLPLAMSEQPGYTTHLGELLQRWNDGEDSAANEIITHSQERLRKMARGMLSDKPHVKRWQQTDDVLQNALIRLHRALQAVNVKPGDKREFTGLAALQIRRELADMARSLYGPEGMGRHHKSEPRQTDSEGNRRPLNEGVDPGTNHAAQLEIHEYVEKLPDDLREVFDLIVYQGLAQTEVAELLGVSKRTVKRRWRESRLTLQEYLADPDEAEGDR